MLCLLSALSLCSRCVACKYGSISRFKGVFRGFPLLDVGLYCFDALRGLWGFCVREWLGGFGACGVFAPVFILLPISFCLSFYLFAPAFVLLSLCFCICSPLLVLFLVFPFLLCLCGFFFPFGCTGKKKGRAVLVRPLLSCCGLVMQNKVFRSRKIRNR